MIITLRDGMSFYVSEENCDRLMRMANDPKTRMLDLRRLNINIKYIAPWDIKRVEAGGEKPMDRSRQLAAKATRPELTEEQRQRNIKKMEDIRRELTKKGVLKPKRKSDV